MNVSADSTDPAIAALSVVEQADAALLDALLENAGSAADLHDHISMQTDDGNTYTLPAATAQKVRSALKRDDPALYRTLHEKALSILENKLRAGEDTHESMFMAVFDRLANHLLTDAPVHFIELMDRVRDIPLTDAGAQQRRHYFEGVALTKAERYEEAIAQFDALLGEPPLDPHVKARAENSRAICCRLTGQLDAALAGYRRSLALWRRIGDRRYEGIVRMNMGITAYELQQYAQAEDHLSQAAGIFDDIDAEEWYAVVQNELGLVYRDRGQWEKALACFDDFVSRRRADGAYDDVGLGLNNIGEVQLFQGRLSDAVATFEEALEHMTTRVYRVDTYLHLGLAQQAAGNLAAAQEAYEEALALAHEINRREILPHCYYRLGDLLRHMDDDAGALHNLRAAARIIEDTRAPVHDEETRIHLLGRWQQVYETLIVHCLARNRAGDAFEWAERARARAFADALLADAGEVSPAPIDVAPVEEIQARLSANSAIFCYFTTGVVARDIPLVRALSDDNPVREYLLAPARTVLFVITPDDLTAQRCPLDPNTFAGTSPRGIDHERFLTPAVRRRLREVLLDVAGSASNAAHIYVLPHGPLHHIPFGALIDSDVQTLSLAPSGTVLARRSPPVSEGSGCLAVGYDSIAGTRSLQFSTAEVTLVADIFDGETMLGPAPKKAKLRERAAGVRWLHIACHGAFNMERPLASYLEVADGERLTAREVLEEWHLSAELVTLSACQTGSSRILRGDEPMGLLRAFLAAGAQAVLVSQWAIEDLPTFLLMYRFYQEVASGGTTRAALGTAQTWLQSLTGADVGGILAKLDDTTALPVDTSPDTRPFAHPRHWAGFVLIGE